jgi:hypothetical protein
VLLLFGSVRFVAPESLDALLMGQVSAFDTVWVVSLVEC